MLKCVTDLPVHKTACHQGVKDTHLYDEEVPAGGHDLMSMSTTLVLLYSDLPSDLRRHPGKANLDNEMLSLVDHQVYYTLWHDVGLSRCQD